MESNVPSPNDERRPAAGHVRAAQDMLLNTGRGRFAARDFGGRGRDVLLVHGTGHNLAVWAPLVEHLAGAFRLAAFDLRGHGQTEVDSTDAEQYWRDIGAMVAAMGLECPLLVGHSTGAYAVTAYAADGGDCAGVVLLDGFVLDARRTPQEAADWQLSREPLWDQYRYGWNARAEEMAAYVVEACTQAAGGGPNAGLDPALVEAFTRRAFLPTGDAYLRRPTLDDLDAVCRSDTSAPIYPAREIYDRLHVPAGFVLASRGYYAQRREEVRTVAAQAANRWFAEVDAGHNVHMQKPGEVAGLLLEHFAS